MIKILVSVISDISGASKTKTNQIIIVMMIISIHINNFSEAKRQNEMKTDSTSSQVSSIKNHAAPVNPKRAINKNKKNNLNYAYQNCKENCIVKFYLKKV
jgi:hypothetical protein